MKLVTIVRVTLVASTQLVLMSASVILDILEVDITALVNPTRLRSFWYRLVSTEKVTGF